MNNYKHQSSLTSTFILSYLLYSGKRAPQGTKDGPEIDWEDARLGDPLIDLAISRLDMAWIFGHKALQTFTEHYQSRMPIEYAALPYWDLCAALRLIRWSKGDLAQVAAFFHAFGRDDISAQTIRNDYKHFVRQALQTLPPSFG